MSLEDLDITSDNVLDHFAEPEAVLVLKKDELEEVLRALYSKVEALESDKAELEDEVARLERVNDDLVDADSVQEQIEEAERDAIRGFTEKVRPLLMRAVTGQLSAFDRDELARLLESEGVNTLAGRGLL